MKLVWAQMWALRGATDAPAQVTQLRKRLLNPPTGVLGGVGGSLHQNCYLWVPENFSRKVSFCNVVCLSA